MGFPKAEVAEALGKDSLMQTIHSLSKASFDALEVVLKRAGVQVEV
jgi:hypothetical protein